MQQIKDMEFSGERPLFASHDLQLDNVRSGTWMASPSRIACLPKVDVLRYGTPKI